jgi:hypothetical protein
MCSGGSPRSPMDLATVCPVRRRLAGAASICSAKRIHEYCILSRGTMTPSPIAAPTPSSSRATPTSARRAVAAIQRIPSSSGRLVCAHPLGPRLRAASADKHPPSLLDQRSAVARLVRLVRVREQLPPRLICLGDHRHAEPRGPPPSATWQPNVFPTRIEWNAVHHHDLPCLRPVWEHWKAFPWSVDPRCRHL